MGQVIFLIITGAFLISLGFLAARFPMLISGYNMLPKHKRDQIDIRPYASFMKKTMIIMGVVIIVGSYLLYFLKLTDWGMVLLLGTSLIGIGILVKRGRDLTKDMNNSNSEIWVFRITIALVAILFFFLIDTGSPAKIVVKEDVLQIQGAYKQLIPIDSIVSVEIIQQAPTAISKANGLSFWIYQKGYFQTKEYGRTVFFLHSGHGPYLVIQSKQKPPVVINRNTKEEIDELYVLLKEKGK